MVMFLILIILQLKDCFDILPHLYSEFKMEIMTLFCRLLSESKYSKCNVGGGDICRVSIPLTTLLFCRCLLGGGGGCVAFSPSLLLHNCLSMFCL